MVSIPGPHPSHRMRRLCPDPQLAVGSSGKKNMYVLEVVAPRALCQVRFQWP